MKYLVPFLSLATVSATAAEYKVFYTTSDSGGIAALDAMTAAQAGKNVYQCKAVELKPSKSGTSISLHPVKKSKE